MIKKINNFIYIQEIDNYKNFRKVLIEYLNLNPLKNIQILENMPLNSMKKLTAVSIQKIIHFIIYINNWKKNSNLFNKYSIFSNNFTKE